MSLNIQVMAHATTRRLYSMPLHLSILIGKAAFATTSAGDRLWWNWTK
jgi:hypothetical protein